MISEIELLKSESLNSKLSRFAEINNNNNPKVNSADYSMFYSFMDIRKLFLFMGILYWLIMTIFIVPVTCVSTLLIFGYPLLFFSRKLFIRMENELCRMVNDHWVSTGHSAGLNEYGDEVDDYSNKKCLCLSNHLGLLDHFCLMTAFSDKNMLTGRYMWVIYNIWKFTPLGLLWSAHGNFFINGGSKYRSKVLETFRDHLKQLYFKYNYGWVVMYPEGSRLFLIQEAEANFCKKNGMQPFRHCAHPRVAAAQTILEVCGPKTKEQKQRNEESIEYIIDCTLGYSKGKVTSLWDAMVGDWSENVSTVAVHFKVHKIQPEWSNEETLKNWLYKQYEIKVLNISINM